MKKLSKFVLKETSFLSNQQMKSIFGGESTTQYHYFVRCNQDLSIAVSAENCDRSTVERICGGEISNAVCVATQY